MGIHNDYEVLKESSSGGAFSAIAEYVLKNDGVVFGATIENDSKIVKHIAVEKMKIYTNLEKANIIKVTLKIYILTYWKN